MISVYAYKVYENERGFECYDRVPSKDARFDDRADAMSYMIDVCQWNASDESIVFEVQEWDD